MKYKTQTLKTKAYLQQSIEDIDSILGEGFAKKTPEILSAYLECSLNSEIENTFENHFVDFNNTFSLIEQRLHSISKSLQKLIEKDD